MNFPDYIIEITLQKLFGEVGDRFVLTDLVILSNYLHSFWK